MNDSDLPRYYTYHSLPHGTCFNKVLLADAITYKKWKHDKEWESTLQDKVISNLRIKSQICDIPNLVVIISRSNRRILNEV